MPKEYVTVFSYKGYEIVTVQNATPDQFGYFVDHYFFADRKYDLVQDAIDDIDRNEKFIY